MEAIDGILRRVQQPIAARILELLWTGEVLLQVVQLKVGPVGYRAPAVEALRRHTHCFRLLLVVLLVAACHRKGRCC